MPKVDITYSLRAGVQKALADTWRQEYPKWEGVVKNLCFMLPPTTLRKAPYVFKESTPVPKPWPYGMPRTRQTIRDRLVESSLFPFELTVPYSLWDAKDDQLGDLKSHLSSSIQRFGLLAPKMIAEYLNGTASLNPSLVNAYDGVSLFSATDGSGAARFTRTGGNIVTSSGLTTAAIFHDLCVVQRAFMAFKDTAGEYIFDEKNVEYTKFTVYCRPELNEVFQTIAKSEFIKKDATSIGGPESNYLKGTFKYELFSYLDSSSYDWYVQAEHPYWKAFAYRAPGDVHSLWEELANSDRARETNEEAFMADVRIGMIPWMPACFVKVNV